MHVRRPDIDFSDVPAHWASTPEFSQHWNASSFWIPDLERFLNRVMAKALASMKADDDPETRRVKSDVRMFIRQEANHYALHDAFNAIVKRDYELSAIEQHVQAEFERLFETKSLAFLTAYCEGFETFGPPGAIMWLDLLDDMLVGASPEVIRLWKWHLMEEYEHRTVCYDVFKKVHGGYFMRIYGLFYQLVHLQGFSAKVRAILLEQDRRGMSTAELKESKRRVRALGFRFAWMMLPRAMKALSPFYTPRNTREPRGYQAYRRAMEPYKV